MRLAQPPLAKKEIKALKLRQCGFSYREIGRMLQLSTQGAQQLIERVQQRIDRYESLRGHRQAIAEYRNRQSLKNLRVIAAAFYELKTILPPNPDSDR